MAHPSCIERNGMLDHGEAGKTDRPARDRGRFSVLTVLFHSLCQDRARKGAAGIYRSECQGAVGEAGLQHGQLLHPVLPRYYGLHTRAISEETQSVIICADLFQWAVARIRQLSDLGEGNLRPVYTYRPSAQR